MEWCAISWGTERSYLKRDETPKLQAASWIQLDVAKRIVGLVGLDLDRMFQRAQMKDFKPLQLPVHLKAHVASQLETFRLEKCSGDAARNGCRSWQERCSIRALRPLGIDRVCRATKIYNGADDNATGCGIFCWNWRARGRRCRWRAAAIDSVRFGHRGGAGLLGSEYLGKTFARAAGKDHAGFEF